MQFLACIWIIHRIFSPLCDPAISRYNARTFVHAGLSHGTGSTVSMEPICAAIDIETTGLEPERDAIIAIGVVVFRGDEILDEWSSLVNPRRRIPPRVTELTGIRQADVGDAPSLFQVYATLERLFSSRRLIAHDVRVVRDFLRPSGLGAVDHLLDTAELATILLPTAGSYGLPALCAHLGIRWPSEARPCREHIKARMVFALWNALFDVARSLDYETLEEIVAAGRSVNWPTVRFFEEVLASVSRTAFTVRQPRRRTQRILYRAPRRSGRALFPADPPRPVESTRIAGLLEKCGSFATRFPHFEHRPQQVEMVYHVAEALNLGQHLMVEAGTGTGKSIAYLLPAVHFAVENDEHIVISTNTINLQDQLISKDIPDLKALLPVEFRAVVLKGRSNYVCPRMVNALRRNGPADADEMRLLAKLLVWLPKTATGERGEISLQTFGEELAWSRLCADNEGCSAETCSALASGCPLNVARQAAANAHLIIINHALLLSDIVTGSNILPEYRYLIVDEAHHLENATTNGLSFRVDQQAIERQLMELTQSRGLLMDLLGRCRATLPPEWLSPVEAQLQRLREAAVTASQGIDSFFLEIFTFLQEHAPGQNRQYSARILVTGGLRIQPSWENVEMAWEGVTQRLHAMVEGLKQLTTSLDDITDTFELPDGDDLVMRTRALQRQLAETRQRVDELVFQPSDDIIYWVELPTSGERISLHAAPLHVGPLVEEHLFHRKNAVILTSATLQTSSPSSSGQRGFDYFRERLNAWEAEELAVGSPFDYESSTLLYLPTDLPEPRQPGYQRLIESSLVSLARALSGRMLVLFTSYSQLRQTATAIRGQLVDAGITVFQQGAGLSRQQILESFRDSQSAVLLGTRSFWEGVDIPGPALSCVVIIKLPFDVPSDPIFAARQESFENPFYEYAVPEAVLRFRQGFGRLIRTQTDRGIVVCLDKRILTKPYGRFFVEALPGCTVRRDVLANMARAAAEWVETGEMPWPAE
jgi:ATP-dependent DNA helicase DinG